MRRGRTSHRRRPRRPPGRVGCTTRMPDLEYTIRRSPRARRIRVKVDPHEGVEVVIPQRATYRDAKQAVAELRPWIDRRLDEAEEARARLASPPGTVPFLGANQRLRHDTGR